MQNHLDSIIMMGPARGRSGPRHNLSAQQEVALYILRLSDLRLLQELSRKRSQLHQVGYGLQHNRNLDMSGPIPTINQQSPAERTPHMNPKSQTLARTSNIKQYSETV